LRYWAEPCTIRNENHSSLDLEAVMDQTTSTISLLSLQKGERGRIAEVVGGSPMVRRMMAMGLRVGSVVDVLNHRGRGIVVGKDGARVALGPDIAEKLRVNPL
jgi:Fe2+ transport system protein FeoA